MVLKAIKDANHLVTLFSSDDYSYIMDATNDVIFWVDKNKQVYLDDTFYKISNMSLFNKKTNSLSKLLKETTIEEQERVLSEYFQIYNSCSKYSDVFEKFYIDNKDLYQDITEKKKILVHKN